MQTLLKLPIINHLENLLQKLHSFLPIHLRGIWSSQDLQSSHAQREKKKLECENNMNINVEFCKKKSDGRIYNFVCENGFK